jgi:hypothetical protein
MALGINAGRPHTSTGRCVLTLIPIKYLWSGNFDTGTSIIYLVAQPHRVLRVSEPGEAEQRQK